MPSKLKLSKDQFVNFEYMSADLIGSLIKLKNAKMFCDTLTDSLSEFTVKHVFGYTSLCIEKAIMGLTSLIEATEGRFEVG